jgi:positive regulator of sigma E activity
MSAGARRARAAKQSIRSSTHAKDNLRSSIVYIVGAVVIIIAVTVSSSVIFNEVLPCSGPKSAALGTFLAQLTCRRHRRATVLRVRVGAGVRCQALS